jgi:hypothetical protein
VQIPKAQKDSQAKGLLVPLGSMHAKAGGRILVQLTPVVYFTKIIQAAYSFTKKLQNQNVN